MSPLASPTTTTLTIDPPSTHRLNANSFQQHALTTAFGWQYAAFYTAAPSSSSPSSNADPSRTGSPTTNPPRIVCLARRRLVAGVSTSSTTISTTSSTNASASHHSAPSEWRRLPLPDYIQCTEDGHNTISMGISHGDGRIHLVWDLHCDRLRYRVSEEGLAWREDEEEGFWMEGLGEEEGKRGGSAVFGGVLGGLLPVLGQGGIGEGDGLADRGPGDQRPAAADNDGGYSKAKWSEDGLLSGLEVTYPRFRSLRGGELLFECRVGRAGAGDAVVCRYENRDGQGWGWRWLGRYLKGVDCSPYVNGVSYDEARNKLWVTWTNRRYTEKQRGEELHLQALQAGPNGPENNEDLGCLVSGDGGESWCAGDGEVLVGKAEGKGALSSRDDRAIVRRIPRDSGIMNQEGQCVDSAGGVHVLMRDDSRDGKNRWKHHWRNARSGEWHTDAVPDLQPTGTGSRGKVCCEPRSGDLYFVNPGNIDTTLTVLRMQHLSEDHTASSGVGAISRYGAFETVWQATGFDGEPLVDEERLWSADGKLSVMTRTVAGLTHDGADVVVLDWDVTRGS